MRYNAIIYHVENFLPMVERVDSRIRFWVVIPDTHSTHVVEDRGSIEDLSNKYEFLAEENRWDLRSMRKRDCLVEINGENIRFVAYR